ncbi:MAG TPA: metallophosphoesterase [Candidatus Melainabacteria bacterium]|nr:metallophosphoesterase [Candidatus Melainabacteria bacterium]
MKRHFKYFGKTKRRGATLAFACLTALAAACAVSQEIRASFTTPEIFIAKPYVQLGQGKISGDKTSHDILFLARNDRHEWELEYKTAASKGWQKGKAFTKSILEDTQPEAVSLFSSTISDLPVGKSFSYRVFRDGMETFSSTAKAQVAENQPFKFIVAGDLGAGSHGQRRIAQRIYSESPDLWVMPGDLVYNMGLLSDYLAHFFPIFNADESKETIGAPIMRSTICVPVIGNHDIAQSILLSPTNLNRMADALGYFLVWSAPLNGPLTGFQGANICPIVGNASRLATFQQAAGKRFPQMANFSFNFGNTHWIVLDGNYYMDWSSPEMRKWVSDDLAKASSAKWKFATFHQPAFSTDLYHLKEQRMRLIVDTLEKGGVDIVFAGHAHNYQRTYPLHFKPATGKMNHDGTVDGAIVLDKNFDSTENTKPNGIIHIVTGAGGARLYSPTDNIQINKMGDFLFKTISDCHSYTVCRVDGNKLTVSQISDSGKVIDKFALKKD